MYPLRECRRGISLAVLLLLWTHLARSELPPTYYEDAQRGAPEVVVLLVESVRRQKEGFGCNEGHWTVTARAKVEKIERSESAIRAGDTITVSYSHRALLPFSTGPRPIPDLRSTAAYRAYLRPEGDGIWGPTAIAMSFIELRPPDPSAPPDPAPLPGPLALLAGAITVLAVLRHLAHRYRSRALGGALRTEASADSTSPDP